jgi:tetratricopeptide (TPR) repeat protein
MRFKKKITMQVAIICLCFTALFIFAQREWKYIKRTQIIYPPQFADKLSFGYKELMSDLFWIRVIQDIDMCEQSDRPAGVPRLLKPKDEQHRPSRCDKGWVFQMLDTVTSLSPRFIIPYQFGGPMLSYIIDDREGAKIIFDKGVKQYPNDWQILYRAAYHYHFEILDQKKAAEYYLRAAQNGAPGWLISLAGRLMSESGSRAAAIRMLEKEIEINRDPRFREGLKERLKNIKNNN